MQTKPLDISTFQTKSNARILRFLFSPDQLSGFVEDRMAVCLFYTDTRVEFFFLQKYECSNECIRLCIAAFNFKPAR